MSATPGSSTGAAPAVQPEAEGPTGLRQRWSGLSDHDQVGVTLAGMGGAIVLWALLWPVPTEVVGMGVLIYPNNAGVLNARSGGQVKTVQVHTGDRVRKGQVLLRLYLPVLEQQLSRQQRDDFYFREVVLLLDKSDKPVEFGAIKINLALFPSAARKEILEERRPLGTLLGDYTIVHTSRPKAYLRIQSDDFINAAFRLDKSQWLYGRRNTLWDPQQRPLAEIVEILPPA